MERVIPLTHVLGKPVIVLLLGVTILSLVACASNDNPTSASTAVPSGLPTTPNATAAIASASTAVPSAFPATPNATATIASTPKVTPTPGSNGEGSQTLSTNGNSESVESNQVSPESQSKFTITSALCSDNQGLDCTKLRLGDNYHTTSLPQNGYLYSCNAKNPNAPGSTRAKLTWISFVENAWDFLKKPWLPEGIFSPGNGIYLETLSIEDRQIVINNLPVDGKIGDWPMTNYPALTEIDRNPGIPSASSSSFTYTVRPSEAPLPTCVSLGVIGVTKNGVVIFNAADGRGNDAVAHEIVDIFGGHPARANYHYHFIPERLDSEPLEDGHSGLVGYINDGFPIYGYKGEGGIGISNEDLDVCHGHNHGELGYHYHATLEYPYTIGCYRGTPENSDNHSPAQSDDERHSQNQSSGGNHSPENSNNHSPAQSDGGKHSPNQSSAEYGNQGKK